MPISKLPSTPAIVRLKAMLKQDTADGFVKAPDSVALDQQMTDAFESLNKPAEVHQLAQAMHAATTNLTFGVNGSLGYSTAQFQQAINFVENGRIEALKTDAVVDANFP
jgi:hypothetical protein